MRVREGWGAKVWRGGRLASEGTEAHGAHAHGVQVGANRREPVGAMALVLKLHPQLRDIVAGQRLWCS